MPTVQVHFKIDITQQGKHPYPATIYFYSFLQLFYTNFSKFDTIFLFN